MEVLVNRSYRGCHGVPDNLLSPCKVVSNLGLLLNIAHTLESSSKIEDVVRPTLKLMVETMKLRRGTITIQNPHSGELQLDETVGTRYVDEGQEDYLQAHRQRFEEVLSKRSSLVVSDITHHRTIDSSDEPHRVALICVPIKSGNDILGVLSVEKQSGERQSHQTDIQLLTLITRVIGQAILFRFQMTERIRELEEENTRLQSRIQVPRPNMIIGNSSAMVTVYESIAQVAPTQATVLVRGESGVGKELVAKAIHEQSDRADKPFIKFNCAALSDSIIESELFGHEKGSFTGAHATRKGRFEAADGGTIFLDEIGDVSPAVQVKLLRVIQEREFERVGGNESLKVDVRIITATSRDLEDMVEAQRFRSDLYYRLNVFPIYVPALRERRSDILLLADYFIEKYGIRESVQVIRRISSAAIDLLYSYHWPGNVRELENVIERAAILAGDASIEARHLPPTLQKGGASADAGKSGGTLEAAVEAVERELIVNTLKEHNGNMTQSAKQLGISERIMGLRVKKYQLQPRNFRLS